MGRPFGKRALPIDALEEALERGIHIGDFIGELDIPKYDNDDAAPESTLFLNTTETKFKYKDNEGAVSAAAPDNHGNEAHRKVFVLTTTESELDIQIDGEDGDGILNITTT